MEFFPKPLGREGNESLMLGFVEFAAGFFVVCAANQVLVTYGLASAESFPTPRAVDLKASQKQKQKHRCRSLASLVIPPVYLIIPENSCPK